MVTTLKFFSAPKVKDDHWIRYKQDMDNIFYEQKRGIPSMVEVHEGIEDLSGYFAPDGVERVRAAIDISEKLSVFVAGEVPGPVILPYMDEAKKWAFDELLLKCASIIIKNRRDASYYFN